MFSLFSFAIIGITLIYTIESVMVEKFITGKITHVGSDIIDKNSQIEISLRDIDVESKLIASTIISNAKTFPISYKLKYNPSDIKPAHTYALSARINGPDNKPRYINDVQTRAKLTDTTSLTIDIAVIRISNTSMTKLNDQKSCRPVKCPGEAKVCPYGYEKKDGCEICRCHDPCNPPGKPILCGSKKRCFIDKKSDGTFGTRCSTVASRKLKRSKDSEVDCNLPKIVGMCKAAFPRFYYDSAMNNCESFIYGGCQGNENNFETQDNCEKTCKNLIQINQTIKLKRFI